MKLSDFSDPSDIVVDLAGMLTAGSSVLDLGAGQGRNSLYLASKGFDATAVDMEDSEIAILQRKNKEAKKKVKILQADIRKFVPEKQYDAVISNTVLHFFTLPEIEKAIHVMKQATTKNGYNLITAYTDKNPPGKRPYLFKHDELKDFYKDWDVVLYEEKPTPWFVYPPRTKRRRNQAAYLIARKR